MEIVVAIMLGVVLSARVGEYLGSLLCKKLQIPKVPRVGNGEARILTFFETRHGFFVQSLVSFSHKTAVIVFGFTMAVMIALQNSSLMTIMFFILFPSTANVLLMLFLLVVASHNRGIYAVFARIKVG